ncbi:MAG: TRAP transporter small permease [Jhaorihella sp.]
MRILRRVLDLSEILLMGLCVLGFILMFALGVATVFFRFVVEQSLTFPDELIRYIFIWMVLLGSAIAFRRGIHAAISMFTSMLPVMLERVVLVGATLASALFFLVLLRDGIALTRVVQPQISPALELSMSWVYAAMPVGGAFLLIYALELLVKLIVLTPEEAMAERRGPPQGETR